MEWLDSLLFFNVVALNIDRLPHPYDEFVDPVVVLLRAHLPQVKIEPPLEPRHPSRISSLQGAFSSPGTCGSHLEQGRGCREDVR